jgi:hypothetical protein
MVKCSSCGKRFDYDKYYGICPKCGSYNRPVDQQTNQDPLWGTEQQDAFGQAEEKARQEQAHWREMEQDADHMESWINVDATKPNKEHADCLRDETKPKKKKSKVNLVLFCCVIACFVIFIALALVSQVIKDGDLQIGNETEIAIDEAEQPPISQGEMEQDLLLEDTYGRTIRVEEARILASPDTLAGLPTGEGLLAVKLVTGWQQEDGDRDYDLYDYDLVDEIYLETSGHYRKSAASYSFEDLAEDPTADLDSFSLYSISYSGTSEGYLFFLYPSDATTATLYIPVSDPDDGDLLYYYEIPLDVMLGQDGTEEEAVRVDEGADQGLPQETEATQQQTPEEAAQQETPVGAEEAAQQEGM